MAKEIEALTILLAARTSEFERGMASAERRIDKVERRMRGSTAVIERDAARMAQRVSASMRQVERSFDLRGVAIGGIGLTALAAEAVKYSDAWTKAGNSLKVAGVEASRQTAVMNALFASAQKNSTEIGALSDVFGKASMNAKELGADEAKLLKFTDGVAVAVKAAGKSTSESSGALLQLGQLLGAGTVRAEEFNSVLEGAPTILTAVAAGMDGAGGSVAKLRAMVLAGEVSSRAFFDAFLKGKPVIDDMAARALPTVGNAMTRINNALTKYVGENQQAQGATRALLGGLNHLADNFDTTADVALKFAGIIAAAILGRSIAGMIVALGAGGKAIKGFLAALATARAAGGVAALASAAGGLAAAAGPVGAILGVAAAAGLYWASSGRQAATDTNTAADSAERYAEALKRVKAAAPEAADAAKAAATRFAETERNRLSGQLAGDKRAAEEAAAAVQKYLDTIIQTAPRRLISNAQLGQLSDLRNRVGTSVDAAVELQEAISKLANTDPKFQRMKDQLQPLLDALIATREAARQTGEELGAIGGKAGGRISRGAAAQGEQQRAADKTIGVDDVATKAELEAAKSDREKAIDRQTDKLAKEYQETGRKIDEAVRMALRERATIEVDREISQKATEEFNTDALKSFVDRVVKAESSGNPNAKNPLSSATGLGQFISSTWLSLFKKHFPDTAKNMSDSAILALRTDAEYSRKLIEAYAKENAAALQSAGQAVTEANLHLAHFLGPQGAVKALKASPGASAREVLGGSVIDANRSVFAKTGTIQDVLDYANRRANATRVAAGDLTPAEQTEKKQSDFSKDNARDNLRKVEDLDAETAALDRRTEALKRGVKEQEFFDAQALRAKFVAEEKRKLEDEQIALTDERIDKINQEADAYVAAEQRKFEAARRSDEAEKSVARTSKAVADAQEFFAEGATSAFTDIITGASSAEEALKRLVNQLLEASIQALLLGKGPLAGLFGTAAGSGGGVGGIFGMLFGGGKASGGRVSKGQVYPVGENGREFFAPGENGRIIPANNLPQPNMARAVTTGATSVTHHARVEVNISGAMGRAEMAQVAEDAAQRGTARAIRFSQKDWPNRRKRLEQLKD